MESSVAQAFANLTTGIYVLTVADGAQHHGMSSSWVTQVSGAPPLFSAAVDNHHFSRAIIARTGVFGMNIVGRRGQTLEDYFYISTRRRRAGPTIWLDSTINCRRCSRCHGWRRRARRSRRG
jgi:flavin reductase (DIM6/NTAB) family NADH-FMN oxidoreductase RutF